jgi:hypothetical protein
MSGYRRISFAVQHRAFVYGRLEGLLGLGKAEPHFAAPLCFINTTGAGVLPCTAFLHSHARDGILCLSWYA